MNYKRFNIYWIDKDNQKQEIEVVATTFTQAIDYLSDENPEFNKDVIVEMHSHNCILII